MIDYSKEFCSLLASLGFPVYYEFFLDSQTKMPCITYYEINNSADETGDTLGYSSLSFSVKIWSDNLAQIQDMALQVDNLLRSRGFNRYSTVELTYGNVIQKQMKYRAKAKEEF